MEDKDNHIADIEGNIVASVEKLNLFYGKKHTLSDINVKVYEKRVLSLIGNSGCGKSSLLKCFNKMIDFVDGCKISGSLKIEDVDIYSPNAMSVNLLRSKVGIVFQKPNPFFKSIYDNVAYAPRLHGINNRDGSLDYIVKKSLMRVGLWDEVYDRLQDNAMELSGGQQQRLCIARAIAVRPILLLMDEPCSALDPKSTILIENLILELKRKFAIVVVTHSMRQAIKISDYVARLERGKIIEYGDINYFVEKLNYIEAQAFHSSK